jgi:hypothetical protein
VASTLLGNLPEIDWADQRGHEQDNWKTMIAQQKSMVEVAAKMALTLGVGQREKDLDTLPMPMPL